MLLRCLPECHVFLSTPPIPAPNPCWPRVKEAMLDSANERITELKALAAAAAEEGGEARLALEQLEDELRALQGGESDKQHSLRRAGDRALVGQLGP